MKKRRCWWGSGATPDPASRQQEADVAENLQDMVLELGEPRGDGAVVVAEVESARKRALDRAYEEGTGGSKVWIWKRTIGRSYRARLLGLRWTVAVGIGDGDRQLPSARR